MMRPAFLAVAAGAFAAASPCLAATPQSETSSGQPPPVIPQRFLKAFQDYCGPERTSVNIDGHPGFRLAVAAEDKEPLTWVVCIDEAKAALKRPIESIDSALAFMAYKPFEPFWPAAEARWGADLSRLRTELHDNVFHMTAENYVYGSLVEESTGKTLVQAHELISLGYYDEASRLLDGGVG